MEKLQKYAWMLKTIQKAGERGISLAQLNEKWRNREDLSQGLDLPRQTFNRWKDELEETFGVIIDCRREDGYRYYIANPEVLEGDDLRAWMLNAIVTWDALSDCLSMRDRVLVEKVSSGQKYLRDVIDAMRNNTVLRVNYRRFPDKEAENIDLEPYCLKMHQRRWYLLARDPARSARFARDELNTYPLDDFNRIDATEQTFTLPEDFDAEQYFSNIFGVMDYNLEPVMRIVLRANKGCKNSLRTLPFHPSQKELRDEGDYADFEVTMSPTLDFYLELLRYNGGVNVIAPREVRSNLYGWAACLKNAFEGDGIVDHLDEYQEEYPYDYTSEFESLDYFYEHEDEILAGINYEYPPLEYPDEILWEMNRRHDEGTDDNLDDGTDDNLDDGTDEGTDGTEE